MASKYAGVIDKLPRLVPPDAKYQDRVNEAKRSLTEAGLSLVDLAKRYTELRGGKDAIEENLSEVNLQIEAVSQLLIDAYEAAGTTSLKLDAGYSVSIQVEPVAQVVDRDAFREWCMSPEQDLTRSLALPWQTTNSLVKERLLAGDPEPPGVTVSARSKLVLRKA